MKKLDTYISEKLVISKDIDKQLEYKYSPKTKEELRDIIKDRVAKEGNECDLNDIDVSVINDMSWLFYKLKKFNGDISEWNVSNVKTMHNMFCDCYKFNGDILKWDVSNVEDMYSMFSGCSNFNQDLSWWDVRNVKDIDYMFYGCKKFDGKKLENWKLGHLFDMEGTFDLCASSPDWWIYK